MESQNTLETPLSDYRPMGFESDVSNPHFAGAQNPDDLLFVEFYMHEPEDWNKSMEQGKMVKGPSIPYIRIQKPGDKTSIIETPVREDHKQRWTQKWLYFQMKAGLISGDTSIPGWKLEEWEFLKEDQIRELKFMRFTVVEQIAGASDDQCQRLGMGGMSLREAAKRALKDRMGKEVKDAIEKKDKEMADMRYQAEREKAAKDAELAELTERLARMEALLMKDVAPVASGLSDSAPEPKKRRGRPRKTELAVVPGNG